jgi:hypothetical protein
MTLSGEATVRVRAVSDPFVPVLRIGGIAAQTPQLRRTPWVTSHAVVSSRTLR